MDRRDFYYRQVVSASDMDEAFDFCEAADRAIAEDHALVGVLSGLTVTEQSPVALGVQVSTGLAYDKNGKKLYESEAQTEVDCSVDEYGVPTTVSTGGNEKWISIFARYTERLTTPAIDGNSQEVYTKIYEDMEFFVRQATEQVSGTDTKVALIEDAILLADIQLVNGQTTIVNAGINLTRREDWLRKIGSNLGTQAFGTAKGWLDYLFDEVDGIATGSGIGHTQTNDWFDSVVLGTLGAITVNDVSDGLEAIVADLAVYGAANGGAELVGAKNYSSTYVSWSSGSIQEALEAVAAATNGHISGGAPAHATAAIEGTLISVNTGHDIAADDLEAQLQDIGTALNGRVYREKGCTRTRPVHVLTALTSEDDCDQNHGAPFIPGLRGGTQQPSTTIAGILQGNWGGLTGNLSPLENENYYTVTDSFWVQPTAVLLDTDDSSDFGNVMEARRIIGMNRVGTLYVIDPFDMSLEGSVLSSTLLAALPSGGGENWTLAAVCSLGNNQIATVWQDEGATPMEYRIQAFTISRSGGVSANRKSGWPTYGTALPTTGNTVDNMETGAQVRVMMANATKLAVLNANCYGPDGTPISIVDMATGALDASGIGNGETVSTTKYLGGMSSDGNYVYWTELSGAGPTYYVKNCQIANPAVYRNITATLSAGCHCLQSDGIRIWAVATDGDVGVVWPSTNTWVNHAALTVNKAFQTVFDGKRLWVQELTAGGDVVLHALDVYSMLTPAAADPDDIVRTSVVMNSPSYNGNMTSEFDMGSLYFDGDSIIAAGHNPTSSAAKITGFTEYLRAVRGVHFR